MSPDLAVRDHVRDAWYQRMVRVPRGWAGERIVLRFDSATHRAVVWVDGEQLAEREGGYTPFEADVTGHVRPGGTARITVVVNNELSWATIPPGHVAETPAGRSLTYFHDFFNTWRYRRTRRADALANRDVHTRAEQGAECSGGFAERDAFLVSG